MLLPLQVTRPYAGKPDLPASKLFVGLLLLYVYMNHHHHHRRRRRRCQRWGDPLNPHERDPIGQVLHPLFDLWRPSVFIHLSEVYWQQIDLVHQPALFFSHCSLFHHDLFTV